MLDEKSISIYSSRDKIRSEIIKLTQDYLELQNFDFNAGSYLSYLINQLSVLDANLIYLISSIYKEMFLTKCNQRESIIAWANLLGYEIQFATPATCKILFEMELPLASDINDSTVTATLIGRQSAGDNIIAINDLDIFKVYSNDGTPFSLQTRVDISFSTTVANDATSVIPVITKQVFDPLYNKVIATQNVDFRYYSDSRIQFILDFIQIEDQVSRYSIPDLLPNEFYNINFKFQKKGTLSDIDLFSVSQNLGTNVLERWAAKTTIFGAASDEAVYGFSETSDGVLITFGNGIIGKQPTVGGEFVISAGTTYGYDGNIIIGSIKTGDPITTNVGKELRYYVTNVEPAINGKDAPTSDEIRQSIIKSFSANDRLVSSVDYLNAKSIIPDLPVTNYYNVVKRSDLKRNEITLFTEMAYNGALVPTRNVAIKNIDTTVDTTSNVKVLKAFNNQNLVKLEDGEDYYMLFDVKIDTNKMESSYIYNVNNVYIPVQFKESTYTTSTGEAAYLTNYIIPLSCYIKQNTAIIDSTSKTVYDLYLRCSIINASQKNHEYSCKLSVAKLGIKDQELNVVANTLTNSQERIFTTESITTINNLLDVDVISRNNKDQSFEIEYKLYDRWYTDSTSDTLLDISGTHTSNYVENSSFLNSSVSNVVLSKNLDNFMYSQLSYLNPNDTVTVGNFLDDNLIKAIRLHPNVNKPLGRIKQEDLDSITILDISGLNIANIQGLQYCRNLISLNASNNIISDISPLEGLVKLQTLNLSNNQIVDVSDLKYLFKNGALTNLNLNSNFITNISVWFDDPNNDSDVYSTLKILDIANNQISSSKFFNRFIRLEQLYLGYNKLTDISGLYNTELVEYIKYIGIQNNTLSRTSGPLNIENEPFAYLQEYVYLKGLSVRNTGFTNDDMKILEPMSSLEELDLGQNKITTLTPYISMTGSIKKLWVDRNKDDSNNKLSSLKGLESYSNSGGLTQSKTEMTFLNLAGNDIKADSTGLELIQYMTKLNTLILADNANYTFTNTGGIYNFSNLNTLILRNTNISGTFTTTGLSFLNWVDLTNCSKIVEIIGLNANPLNRVSVAGIADNSNTRIAVQNILYNSAISLTHTFAGLTNASTGPFNMLDVMTTHYDEMDLYYTNVSNDQVLVNQYLYSLYDIPVIKKSYYDNLTNQISFNSTVLDKIITFNPFSYRMLTDFVSLKFLNTTGKANNMKYNKTTIQPVIDVNNFDLSLYPEIGDRFAFSSNNNPWYSYFKNLLNLQYSTNVPNTILTQENGFIADYQYDTTIYRDYSYLIPNGTKRFFRLESYKLDEDYIDVVPVGAEWEAIDNDLLLDFPFYDTSSWDKFTKSGWTSDSTSLIRSEGVQQEYSTITLRNTPWEKNNWYKISLYVPEINGSFTIRSGNWVTIIPDNNFDYENNYIKKNDAYISQSYFTVYNSGTYCIYMQVTNDTSSNLMITDFDNFQGEITNVSIQKYYGWVPYDNTSKTIGKWIFTDLKVDDIVPVSNLKDIADETKYLVYTGSKLVEPIFDIPLKIELTVKPNKSITISYADLINNIKEELIKQIGPNFGYNKNLYRSQIVNIVQNVSGVENCTVISPSHDIFYDSDQLTNLTQEQILTYTPELVYFTTNSIYITIKE